MMKSITREDVKTIAHQAEIAAWDSITNAIANYMVTKFKNEKCTEKEIEDFMDSPDYDAICDEVTKIVINNFNKCYG